MVFYRPRTEASEESIYLNTVMLNFQLPKLKESAFLLFKPPHPHPGLRGFVPQPGTRTHPPISPHRTA